MYNSSQKNESVNQSNHSIGTVQVCVTLNAIIKPMIYLNNRSLLSGFLG